jgi:hypothetical protein
MVHDWLSMFATAAVKVIRSRRLTDSFRMRLRFWKKRERAGDGSPLPRRTGRLCQHTLSCNLGRVLDISAGGMRIITRKVPRGFVDVHLVGHPLPGSLKAVRQWSRRLGWFRHEVGLRFETVTPDVAQRLSAIACSCRLRSSPN